MKKGDLVRAKQPSQPVAGVLQRDESWRGVITDVFPTDDPVHTLVEVFSDNEVCCGHPNLFEVVEQNFSI